MLQHAQFFSSEVSRQNILYWNTSNISGFWFQLFTTVFQMVHVWMKINHIITKPDYIIHPGWMYNTQLCEDLSLPNIVRRSCWCWLTVCGCTVHTRWGRWRRCCRRPENNWEDRPDSPSPHRKAAAGTGNTTIHTSTHHYAPHNLKCLNLGWEGIILTLEVNIIVKGKRI